MTLVSIFIDINNPFIDINKWIIDINKWIIVSIKMALTPY